MIWFLENSERSKRERLELEQLAGGVDWLLPIGWRMESSRLSWDADIIVGEQMFPITLRYPNHFPFSPPLVLPRGDQSRWSFHQYGAGGELCLEYGPDNWQEDITGAEMIRSAYRLLLGEAISSLGGPEVQSRHHSSLGEHLSGKRRRFFFDQESQAILSALVDDQVVVGTAITEFHEQASIRFLVSAEVGDHGWKAGLPAPLVNESFERATVLIRWPEALPLPPDSSAKAMCAAIAERGIEIGSAELIVFVHGPDVCVYQLDHDNDTTRMITVILEQERQPRLDPAHESLEERQVAIIGCGSVGSKVATMLARSGVLRFILVDEDIFLPENLVRNDLDWRDAGLHKVDAVARKVQLVNPKATCDRYRKTLGGQASTGAIEGLIEVLEQCDLLLDASADNSAFEVLSAVASFGKRTMVWGQVFAGGIGGFVARSRSGQEPKPAIMRRKVEAWCAEKGRIISPASAPYEGGDSAPVVANDAEVSIIASHLAALAIDTLISQTPSSYRHAVYLIGLKAEWIFDQAFEVYPIDVGPPTDAVLEPLNPDNVKAELLEILKRLAEHPNAAISKS
jgi:hypothetical protein